MNVVIARRRSEVRRAVTVSCEVVSQAGFRLVGRRTIDLSPTGMLVEAERLVRIGEEIIVSLKAPGTSIYVDTSARVARVVRGRRTTDRAPAIGLRFTDMDPVSRHLLAHVLAGTPPPVPARRARADYARDVIHVAVSALAS